VNLCDNQLAAVLSTITERYGWRCETLASDDRALISTGRHRADSEPIRLLARLIDSETLLVSDGGETLSALLDVGFDRADVLHEGLWQEALRTYRLSEVDGRVFLQAPIAQAPFHLNRLADALVALDGLRITALPPIKRSHTLADQVEDYLRTTYGPKANIKKSPEIRLAGGLTVRPSLQVDTPQRTAVLVQPGSTSSQTQSYDHAYTTFDLAARGGIPKERRLVVLGGSVGSWNATRLRALSRLAYVGFYAERKHVRKFLDGETPEDSILLPHGLDAPMMSAPN
jgi:hypothetical protein